MIRVARTAIAVAAVLMVTSGCILFVEVRDTTIEAQNEMTDLTIEVNGVPNDVTGIDLSSVVIGDVLFSSVPAGTRTSEHVTGRRGTVDITIGSAVAAVTYPLNADYEFSDIDPMETVIAEAQTNTVVFDETTAGTIFTALAKRRR